MIAVTLHDGSQMLCDQEDYRRFCIETDFATLYVGNHGYIRFWMPGGKKHLLFHRWLLNDPDGEVSHRDSNRRNNCRNNLRVTTHSINRLNLNDPKYCNNTSGYRGVHWHEKTKQWIARIDINGQRTHLGCFPTKELAIKARQEAEIQMQELTNA